MPSAPFRAQDMSVAAQTFLYACAFWAVAADEKLGPLEQQWLVEQFGEDGITKSLDEYVALGSDEFVEAFDNAAAALPDEEKAVIYPRLEAWLLSCAHADGTTASEERDTLAVIKKRLSLDSEIRRLAAGEPAQAADASQSVHGDSARTLVGHAADITGVAITPDGRYVLSGSEDGTLKFWDFEQGTELRTFRGHVMGVSCLGLCAKGNRAISGDRMGALRMWDVDSGQPVWTQEAKRGGGMTGVAVSADGALVTTCSDVGALVVRDLERGGEIRTMGDRKRGALRAVAISPDGARVLAGGDEGTLRLWELATGRETGAWEGHQGGVTSLGFSPDGREVVSGSRDNTVIVWDAATGRPIRRFTGHTFNVMGVCFSPGGRLVMSASWDHSVKVWDVKSGRSVVHLESVGGSFSCAAFHPDGRRAAIGCSDKLIYLVTLELA